MTDLVTHGVTNSSREGRAAASSDKRGCWGWAERAGQGGTGKPGCAWAGCACPACCISDVCMHNAVASQLQPSICVQRLTAPLPRLLRPPAAAYVLDPNTPRSPKHQLAEQILTTGAPAKVVAGVVLRCGACIIACVHVLFVS